MHRLFDPAGFRLALPMLYEEDAHENYKTHKIRDETGLNHQKAADEHQKALKQKTPGRPAFKELSSA